MFKKFFGKFGVNYRLRKIDKIVEEFRKGGRVYVKFLYED